MSTYDLIVRGGTLVTPEGQQEADIGVSDGKIAAIEPDLEGTAAEEADARGLHVLPGAIEAHVHFNEPGRAEWESFATGSRSLAAGEDMFRAWGGIAGCQSLLNVMLDEGHHERGLPLEEVAALLSGKVADRFGFSGKGRLEVGADADLALVDLDALSTLHREDLLYRHKISPYIGRAFTEKVVRTLVRGNTVFRDGKALPEPVGKLIKPDPAGTPSSQQRQEAQTKRSAN